MLNVGWGYYTLWIVGGGGGRPPGLALDFFRQAAQLDPTNPVDLLDLGIADLATSHYQAGAQSFRAGVAHMLYNCPAGGQLVHCTTPQPPTSYDLQQAWFAGGMETLEALAQSKEAMGSVALRAAITSAKDLLADSMASGKVTGPHGKTMAVPGLGAFLDPNYLELDVPVPKVTTAYRMAGMPITVLWYERPPGGTKWSAISETACWGHGQQVCGRYDRQYNTFQFVTRFLAADDQCFTNVEYRAELYVTGNLAGSLTLSPKDDYIGTNLAPALSKTMNVGICAPSSWHLQALPRLFFRVHGRAATVSGTLSTSELSYASADHKEGVYLFRFTRPALLPPGPAQHPEGGRGGRELRHLRPARPGPAGRHGAAGTVALRRRVGPGRVGHDHDRLCQPQHRHRSFRGRGRYCSLRRPGRHCRAGQGHSGGRD